MTRAARRLALLIAAAAALAGVVPTGAQAADLTAYQGLGAWIDIYDGKLMATPDQTAAALKARGVNTIYVETGNSSQAVPLVRPTQVAGLIQSAHRRGMRVVGWYLPDLRNPGVDYRRALGAIRFRTPLGQSFDAFALDIESPVITPVSLRNARLLSVSQALRRWAPAGYPLGAIIPAPRGMELSPTYWPGFPYTAIASIYDIFLPMGYYTNRVSGEMNAYWYSLANARIIWRETGDPTIPVHLIGGAAAATTRWEVRGFVHAVTQLGLAGGSLYDAATTRLGAWLELAALHR